MSNNISFTGLYQTYKIPQTLKASSNVAFKNYIEDMLDEDSARILDEERQKRIQFEHDCAAKITTCKSQAEALKVAKEIVSDTLRKFGGTFGK